MATILPDRKIKELMEVCIKDASEECIKPNSYELRLGRAVKFLSTGEQKTLHEGEFLEIQPGEIVQIASLEYVDFSLPTVQTLFPHHALMGLLTPTTTMMREGMLQASTKVDAGYKGLCNWSVRNSSFKPIRLAFGEHLFKLTIFELGEGEAPDHPYGTRATDHYQETDGIASSKRMIPADIPKEKIVQSSIDKIDPKKQLQEAGYPYNFLSTELVALQGKFEIVSKDVLYLKDEVGKQITQVSTKIDGETQSLLGKFNGLSTDLKEKMEAFFSRKLISVLGYIVTIGTFSFAAYQHFLKETSSMTQICVLIGVGIIAFFVTYFLSRHPA